MTSTSPPPTMRQQAAIVCDDMQKQSFVELCDVADQLEQLADALESGAGDGGGGGGACLNALPKIHAKYSKETRRLYNKVVALGKMLDKATLPDLDQVSCQGPLDANILDRVVVNHLLREGRLNVAQSMIQESGMQGMVIDPEYVQFHQAREALRQREIAPCLRWIETFLGDVGVIGRNLAFALHRLQFLEILHQRGVMDAILYSQAHFPQFFQHYQRSIEKLMGFIGLYHCRKVSEHSDQEQDWTEVDRMFSLAFCKKMGLGDESPLFVGTFVGRLSLPRIMKMKMLEQKRAALKVEEAHIPIEIDLDKNFQYHSTFVCPVLKTVEAAPPVLLKCGHVISQAAMKKITRTSRHSQHRIKCPTCPQEQTPKDVNIIYL